MENRNKKRSASSDDASPRSKKRSLADETFDSVRNNAALVMMIYSFLPTKDRVRLGKVDKQFYEDDHRGQIEGIYGDECLDIEMALEEVRNYVNLKHNLDSMIAFGNPPVRSSRYDEESCREVRWIANKLQRHWFDAKVGWDLEAIQEHADFGEHQEFAPLDMLKSINLLLQDDHRKLDELTADIKKLGPLAPYNKLFELMEKHDMKYDHFLHAEEPPIHEFSEHAYMIGKDYLKHLRPGRMTSSREADGKMIETLFRACSRCNEVKEDVWDASCDLDCCGTTISVCRACTTNRTCSGCGAGGCRCLIEKCCVYYCQNYICHNNLGFSDDEDDSDDDDDSDEDDSDEDDGKDQGCSFVFYPEDTYWDDEDDLREIEQKKYCMVHKPAGAVKFDRRN